MHIKIDGVYLNVVDEGRGPPLVFIHGLGGSYRSWEGQIEAFREEHYCIAADNRGAGNSEVVPGPYSFDIYSDDTAGICRRLGVEEAVVVGQSMGGVIAQALAIRHPRLVKGLVLVDTICFADARVKAACASAEVAILEKDVRELPRMFADQLYSKAFRREHPELIRRGAREMANTSPDSLIAALRAASDFDLRDGLPGLRVPTLVIVGAEDGMAPPENAEAIAQLIPCARLVSFPTYGHQPHIEAPTVFNQLLREFIATSATVPAAG